MASLTPELQAALAAQIEYYRDLGIFDLYRRAGDAIPLEVAAPIAEELPFTPEEPVIAARRVTATPRRRSSDADLHEHSR